jgi:hypothetical protein
VILDPIVGLVGIFGPLRFLLAVRDGFVGHAKNVVSHRRDMRIHPPEIA